MKRSKKTVEVQDEAFFPVQSQPVYTVNPTSGEYELIVDKQAIVRPDTNHVLSVMSKFYKPVSNKVVLETFGKIASEAGIEWARGENYIIRGGTKTIMKIQFPQYKLSAGKLKNKQGDDVVQLEGLLSQSFDGYNAVRFDLGFYRLVCSNGAMAWASDMNFYHKHVGQVSEKLIETFRTYMSTSLQTAQKTIKDMTHGTFATNAEVTSLFESVPFMPDKYREDLMAEWKAEGKSLNHWEVYNVFTKVITHKIVAGYEMKVDRYKALNRLVNNGWKVKKSSDRVTEIVALATA